MAMQDLNKFFISTSKNQLNSDTHVILTDKSLTFTYQPYHEDTAKLKNIYEY